MSRSTVAKSRQEKTNKTTSAPTPAVTHEIVPGKFNDQDWYDITPLLFIRTVDVLSNV